MKDKDTKLLEDTYKQVNESKLPQSKQPDLFRKEKLAREFAVQYKVDPNDPMYPTILNAFAIGYSFGQKDASS